MKIVYVKSNTRKGVRYRVWKRGARAIACDCRGWRRWRTTCSHIDRVNGRAA